MPKNHQPLVDRYPQKAGEGWLLNPQQQTVCCFRNALPSVHAKWMNVETRSLQGSGRSVLRRMLRHNAIEAWVHMLKTGWIRCPPMWPTAELESAPFRACRED